MYVDFKVRFYYKIYKADSVGWLLTGILNPFLLCSLPTMEDENPDLPFTRPLSVYGDHVMQFWSMTCKEDFAADLPGKISPF